MTCSLQHESQVIQEKITSFLNTSPFEALSALPEGFIEFCKRSIENVRGEQIHVNENHTLAIDEYDLVDEATLSFGAVKGDRLIPINPTPSNRPIAAVDTATMKLGELSNGALCALRGAVVLLNRSSYSYVRYGPMIFSIGDHSDFSTIESFGNVAISRLAGEVNPDSLLKRIRNSFERWLQTSLCTSLRNGLVLLDGSLTAGTPDNPTRNLQQILELANKNMTQVFALSKKTKLRVGNRPITDFLDDTTEPCVLDVDADVAEQFPPYPVRFLGHVFVAKLSRLGIPFRLDVDRHVQVSDAVRGISELIGTDLVYQGYPEVLRLAHILSTFTASDALAMQALVQTRFRVQVTREPPLRRTLFGPFGSGWEP